MHIKPDNNSFIEPEKKLHTVLIFFEILHQFTQIKVNYVY